MLREDILLKPNHVSCVEVHPSSQLPAGRPLLGVGNQDMFESGFWVPSGVYQAQEETQVLYTTVANMADYPRKLAKGTVLVRVDIRWEETPVWMSSNVLCETPSEVLTVVEDVQTLSRMHPLVWDQPDPLSYQHEFFFVRGSQEISSPSQVDNRDGGVDEVTVLMATAEDMLGKLEVEEGATPSEDKLDWMPMEKGEAGEEDGEQEVGKIDLSHPILVNPSTSVAFPPFL